MTQWKVLPLGKGKVVKYKEPSYSYERTERSIADQETQNLHTDEKTHSLVFKTDDDDFFVLLVKTTTIDRKVIKREEAAALALEWAGYDKPIVEAFQRFPDVLGELPEEFKEKAAEMAAEKAKKEAEEED